MSDILITFLDEEVTTEQYAELFDFIASSRITRGTFIGNYHTILKAGYDTIIIYREIITPGRSLKYKDAFVIGKEYLLKKLNSIAYARKFREIKNIPDSI